MAAGITWVEWSILVGLFVLQEVKLSEWYSRRTFVGYFKGWHRLWIDSGYEVQR